MTLHDSFLSQKEYNTITNDIHAMLRDTQISVKAIFKETGTIDYNITTGLISDSAGLASASMSVTFGGYSRDDVEKFGSMLPETDTVWYADQTVVTSPELIDRFKYDSEEYQVIQIRQDTARSHWRMLVRRRG